MINFLVHRPIAVTMTFIALMILGLAAMTRLPVSLMPDIDIPEITVQIEGKNTPVRQLENGVVRPIRRQLLQVPNLDEITSDTRDENAVIRMKFEYGTDIDLAFIDVNEKIDRSMNFLPKDFQRPRVIKASASDIPVFYLNVMAEESFLPGQLEDNEVSGRFTELSRFTGEVIKKRLEQLPEVAMADISGTVESQISIVPDEQKLSALNLHHSDIEQAIRNNNLELGNITVKDGIYQYNLRFENTLNNKHNIENILLETGEKTIKLKELAEIEVKPRKRNGLITSGHRDAISLAIIKKSDARMQDMKASLNNLLKHLRSDYRDIDFEVTRDQTRLLDYSIHNLNNTLILGAILAFVVMFLFLRDIRSPLLIGISIPTSLIISILFFFIFDISINIISLSGLVLGIGMMIDNSIIVIDNITQFIDRGNSLIQACVKGTNEVIRPLLSSVLTTCAVFIPLIFISGLAGALFYDQAIAVAIGLFSSFLVSITLIPVYYKLFYKKSSTDKSQALQKLKLWDYYASYEKGLKYVLRNQKTILAIFIGIIGIGIFTYQHLSVERLPQIQQDEMFISVDWNQKINIRENKKRSLHMVKNLDTLISQSSVYAGIQKYIMSLGTPDSPRETKIYLKCDSPENLEKAKKKAKRFLSDNYPEARYQFLPPENIFEMLFANEEPPLVGQILPFEKEEGLNFNKVKEVVEEMNQHSPSIITGTVPSEDHIEVSLKSDLLLTYGVTREKVVNKLKSLFSEYKLTELRSSQNFMPIILGHREGTLLNLIEQSKVENENGANIPLKKLIELHPARDFKTITAGKTGEYFPLEFSADKKNAEQIQNKAENILGKFRDMDINWSGSIFTNQQMVKEIAVIMLISLLLLYFILASQFESLSLPLIVLLEVPIATTGAFLMLKISGVTINIMSLIGIIVMTGIIINDSILKIDTINRLRREGMTLVKSLIIGGQRRLKPILMTSITTIMAMVPFLFISGMGSDLQKPLAVSVIGGMFIGTFVSLFFIPLFYHILKYRKEKMKTKLKK